MKKRQNPNVTIAGIVDCHKITFSTLKRLYTVTLTTPYHFSLIAFGRFKKNTMNAHPKHVKCLQLKKRLERFVCLISWHTLSCYRDIIVNIMFFWQQFFLIQDGMESPPPWNIWHRIIGLNQTSWYNVFCWFYFGAARPHQIFISPAVAISKFLIAIVTHVLGRKWPR